MSPSLVCEKAQALVAAEELDYKQLNTLPPHLVRWVMAKRQEKRFGRFFLLRQILGMMFYLMGLRRSY